MSVQTQTSGIDDTNNSQRLEWLLAHVGDGIARDLGHTQRSNLDCARSCIGCKFQFSCARGVEQTPLDY